MNNLYHKCQKDWKSNDTIIYRDENEEPKGFKNEQSNYRKDKNHKK